MENIAEIIGRNIKRLREERGLRVGQLSKKLGCDSSNVSSWEHGQYAPSAYFLDMLAAAFECSMDELFRREGGCVMNRVKMIKALEKWQTELEWIKGSHTWQYRKKALAEAIAALREKEELATNLQQRASNEQVTEPLRPNGFSGLGDELATKNQVKPGWISVKERLPELEKEVLICDLSDERDEGPYMDVWSLEDDEDGGVVWAGKDGAWYSLNDVTHWMPLPEPPKGGCG